MTAAALEVVDPGSVNTWPPDIRQFVERLAVRCRAIPANRPNTPSYELALERIDEVFDVETMFRQLIGERHIPLFHATRLLPHEEDSVRLDGLLPLSTQHRDVRLDQVIEIYGRELGMDRLELLRHAGPLTWNSDHRQGRLGVLCGVTPLQDAFAGAGTGMTVFLENWGGESFYWAGEEASDLQTVLGALTGRSQATIVEVAVSPAALNTYTHLWQIFVGQLDGWEHAWHEFQTRTAVPPDRVLAMIHEASDGWPTVIGPLR